MSVSVNLSDDSKRYLRSEWAKAHETAEKLGENLSESSAWKHQYLTSGGTYLGDLYKTVENTLRTIVEEVEEEKPAKNDRWHQALLEKGCRYNLIPEEHYKTIRGMLSHKTPGRAGGLIL